MKVANKEEQEQKQKAKVDLLQVLIADDDAPTRVLLRSAISQWGYTITEAKDGNEAWEIMQGSNPPQLLILDWLMPGLDGLQLCERIKREIPVNAYIILLTQQTGSANLIKGLEAGADEFLSKPFNMAELRSRLSIGARIIRYQNQIMDSNKLLLRYISDIETRSMTALKITQNIYDVIKRECAKSNEKNSEMYLKSIQEINNVIQNTIDTVNKYRSDLKK